MFSLQQLIQRLQPDPWRQEVGFSPDLVEVQNLLLSDTAGDPDALATWLQKFQPCLFGRAAAKLGLIRFCILREDDLTSDEAVRDMIRRKWTADAFDGKASAFIVLLVSDRVANALPNDDVLAVAHRLCSLYLRDVEVQVDCIHHERIWLEKPGPERATWEWLAGVNYFCAQGDQRWWHDHRIPGGMAFSVNSVGHMARAGKIAQIMDELNVDVGVSPGEYGSGRLRSLEEALMFAMLTIDNASEAVSGRATELLPLNKSPEASALPTCPVKLPPKIADKNHCEYAGWYHTDYTLPQEYFSPAVERSATINRHRLDFTYLSQHHVDNPAFEVMGSGRRIRVETDAEAESEAVSKENRMVPREVLIDNCERLRAALAENRSHQ